MLAAALDLLACPHCAGPLDTAAPGVVGCFAGHRFDIARQGYLTLLGRDSRTDTGDDAQMVTARAVFLEAGHYQPIAAAITAAVVGDGPVLEVGAGTGYYLAAAVDPEPDRIGLAIDSSRFAARRAARVHPRIAALVADAWAVLPVRGASMATVLSVFAPRNPAEIHRVLEPGGRLVVVTPGPDHLAEIAGPLGLLAVDPGKADRVADLDGFEAMSAEPVRFSMRLSRADAVSVARMGPAARHRSEAETEAAAGDLSEPIEVTAAVTVTVLQRA